MEYKHTPGEWQYEGLTVYALNEDGFNRFSALIQDAHTCEEELEANARLIAAAPGLFSIAINLVAWVDGGCECTSDIEQITIYARTALAQATGEQK